MLNIILKDAIHAHSDTLWYAVKAEKGSHALKSDFHSPASDRCDFESEKHRIRPPPQLAVLREKCPDWSPLVWFGLLTVTVLVTVVHSGTCPS